MTQPLNVPPCPAPGRSRVGKATQYTAGVAFGAALLALGACGGGSHDSPAPAPVSSPAPAPAPTPASAPGTVTGTAASGAAFAGAHLTAVDKTGTTVCDTTVSEAGNYSCALPASTQPPLVISAVRNEISLFSVKADATEGTVNITPITTIVAARLAPSGDPASLAAAIQSDPALLDGARINDQINQVVALLKPLTDALGDSLNPLSGSFAADGTGHDGTLDALQVSIRPEGASSNIEVTVKSIPASADAAPTAVSFKSADATLPTLPHLSAAALPPAGAGPALADLMARSIDCYALPLSKRVNASGDATAVTGTAGDVIAPQCRGMFFNSDPAAYLHNGLAIGRDAQNRGAFTGLFRAVTNGVKFRNAEVGYYLPNGDAYITYQSVDAGGTVGQLNSVVRISNGVAGYIGNQDRYGTFVSPAVQLRDFINHSQYSYVNVGYDVTIPNILDAGGAPLLDHVDVTAPDGTVYRFAPTVGNNNLRLKLPNGTVSGTSIIRMNAAFLSTSTAGHPSNLPNENLIYASPLSSDAQIEQMPDQSAWTFVIQPLNQPAVTQHLRTISRTMTLAEARQAKFPRVTAVSRAHFQGITSAQGNFAFTTAPSAASPNVIQLGVTGGDYWEVPEGAVAPTSVSAYGRAPSGGPTFDDSASVSNSARRVTIYCSAATVADLHCDASTGITQYAQGDTVNYTQLYALDSRLLAYFSGIAYYNPGN